MVSRISQDHFSTGHWLGSLKLLRGKSNKKGQYSACPYQTLFSVLIPLLFSASAAIHSEVLQTLLLSPSCPRPVLNLCSPGILRLLSARKAQGIPETSRFDSASIRRVAMQSLGPNHAGLQFSPAMH